MEGYIFSFALLFVRDFLQLMGVGERRSRRVCGDLVPN